jgi:EmrB/QacA subfamily drug resistance transporter
MSQDPHPPLAARDAGEAPALHDRARARRLSIALSVIVMCQLMVILDATIVNVALPKIQSSLHFSATGLAWVLNSYTLVAGGLLLLGGRAGDVWGRRRMLIWGLSLFTLASLLGGLAPTAALLLAARVLQGVGAAFAAPASLSLIATNFKDGEERHRALGAFSMVAGLGLTIGLILGGLLAAISWRWVFIINVPIGLAAVLLARPFLVETPRHAARFDVAGAVTSTGGVAFLVYGFIHAASSGWANVPTEASFAVGVVLLAIFVSIELRVTQPIMSLHLLTDRTRGAAFLNMLLLACSMSATFFFLSQFLQEVLGYTTIETGAAFLPLAATQFATARLAPKLVPRFGPKPVTTVGVALAVATSAWLSQLSEHSNYVTNLLGPMILFGLGVGLCFMPLNTIILAGLQPKETGSASGLLQALQRIGGTLGIAVLVTVFGNALRDAQSHPVPGLGHVAQARHALAHGIAMSFAAGTVFVVVALLVSLFVIKNPKKAAPAPQPVAAQR